MAQFEIHRFIPMEIGGVDVSFTNSSLFMVLVLGLITLFMTLSMRRSALVPSRMQSVAELSYEFVANMMRDTVGSGGQRFFPFVFTLFMFVLFANMLGMVPYSFTITSHIIVTFALAATVFLGVTVLGFIKHGAGYLRLFVPHGVPVALLPLIVVIEVISYLSRPISLSVRLFANMMAGHTMIYRRLAAAGVFGGLYRARNSGRVPAGLCVCGADLYLSQRCVASALKARRRISNAPMGGFIKDLNHGSRSSGTFG